MALPVMCATAGSIVSAGQISLSSTYSNVTGNFDLGNLSSDVSEVTSTVTRGELGTEEDSSDEEDISRIPDVSIRVNSSFQEPREVLEESIEDVAPGESFTEDAPVKYEMLMGASQRGKDILSDSIGYTYMYNVKERNKKSTVWWCSVRNNSTRCPARVRQTGSSFELGGQEHNHAPVPSKKSRIIITQQSSQQASQQLFTAASGIVESVANEVTAQTDVEQPNIDYIVRMVNRNRQRLRPEDPKDLDFEVNEEFIPDSFYRGDVRVEDRSHLLFATDYQLRLLKSAKRWYLDGTFKVVREPFDNLMTIHAFVRRGDCAKQIPLMFALMSGRRTKDYVKVLKKVGRLLDREVEVEDFVVDFEAAMWKALRHVFGNNVQIHGCAFHWGQAVWRQVQAKSLATEYTTKRETYSYIRKLLCLPFFPPEHILEVFDSLVDIAPCRFDGLLDYMRATWFGSRVWPVECWSIYGMSIRTNNDVEGWHRRLNGRAGAAPPFYLLIKLLAGEGQVALRNVSLVTELQLTRYQRRQYQTMQDQIIDLWNKYSRGEVSATGLLKQISTKYKTSVNRQ